MKNQPIRNAQEYEIALATVSALFDNPPQPDTAEGDYFDVLITLIEAYELKHFPIDLPDPRWPLGVDEVELTDLIDEAVQWARQH